MTLQSSGLIRLSQIQTEFGGSNPIGLSEYYDAASGVPASGEISLSDFYGTSNVVDITYHVVGAGGGGGGAGAWSSGTAGGTTSIASSAFTTVSSGGGAGGQGGGRLSDTSGISTPGSGGAGVVVGGVSRGAGGNGGTGTSNPSDDVELGGAGGGGAGGTGGPAQGGGFPVTAAGQYKTGTVTSILPGTVITVTVGSGGTGGLGYQSSALAGANGSDGFVRLTINGTNYDFTSSGTHTV